MDFSGFKSLFYIQQNATLLIDESDQVILANPLACELLGYSEHEIKQLSIKALIPNLDNTQEEKLPDTGKDSSNDYLISRNNHLIAFCKNGQELNVNISLARLTSDKYPIIISIFYDRRRRAEDSLRKSEERLNLAKRAAGLGLYDRDLNSNELYWDDRARELLGFSADEDISYEKFEACIQPEDREMRRAVLQQALNSKGKDQYQTEFRITRKSDGATRWISSTGQVSYESGRPMRLLGLMRDITDVKAMESHSNWRRNETEILLKQQIAVQTASAIAHEINQPLTAISAYSEVALHSMKNSNINSESLFRALEGCVREAQRAGDTLHELMNYLAQREMVVEPVDINQLIRTSIDTARKDGYNSFNPSLHLEKNLPHVMCCPLQVQKVILNLLRNATDASQESGFTEAGITISSQKTEKENMALITVQDNGPGFDKEAAKRVFQPFFTTKRTGIGMGLVISRSLIEANGGTLWHDPDSKSGAIIHFTLPFAT